MPTEPAPFAAAGDYELADELASVGHQTLYSATRCRDGRTVEILLLSPDAPEHERRLFSKMAGILERVDHPGCVEVLDVGQFVGGSLHIVTASSMSAPLSSLRPADLEPRLIAEIALQLSLALEHLHERDLVAGALVADGITIGDDAGEPRVRIVDFSNARTLPDAGRLDPAPEDRRFVAPEVLAGGNLGPSTDAYALGVLLSDLAERAGSPVHEPALLALTQELRAADPSGRPRVDEARARLESWLAESTKEFDAAWLPLPQPRHIRSGLRAAPSVPIAPPHAVAPPPMPIADSRHRRPLAFALTAVGLGLLGLAAYAVAASSDEGEPSPEMHVAAAAVVPPPELAVQAPAPAVSAEPPSSEAGAPEGNPIVWLGQVNRRDLETVLPLVDRKALLRELGSREGVAARINHRWNGMLDLLQAGDADRPCATFAAALASLDGPPADPVERSLIDKVVVPVPGAGSPAGVTPDESCTGLAEAFDRYRNPDAGQTQRRKRKSKHRGGSSARSPASPKTAADAQRPQAGAPPAAAPEPRPAKKRRRSVASKLDDDLRDF